MKRLILIGALLTGGGAAASTQVLVDDSFCPSGWTQHAEAGDDHAVVYACESGDWLVVLTPDKTFDYGLGPDVYTEDPTAVPGWVD